MIFEHQDHFQVAFNDFPIFWMELQPDSQAASISAARLQGSACQASMSRDLCFV